MLTSPRLKIALKKVDTLVKTILIEQVRRLQAT